MYHPYRDGYHVRPGLAKTSHDEIFDRDCQLKRYLEEKQEASLLQPCIGRENLNPEIELAALQLVEDYYPETSSINLDSNSGLDQLSDQIQEDLIIHCLNETKDWMAGYWVCLPSSWAPEKMLGKSFVELHQPVPGMRTNNGRKLLQACLDSGPYQRFQWSVIFGDRLNHHPSRQRFHFDPDKPFFLVKVERQVLVAIPDHRALLFVLRQHLIPESETDCPALLNALQDMNSDQVRYKGLTQDHQSLCTYLSSQIS